MEETSGDENGLLCFLAVIACTIALAYIFVFRNAPLVTDWTGFWILIGVLIGMSFILSAVEAGFSGAPKDRRLAAELAETLAAKAQKYSEADKAVDDAGEDLSVTAKERKKRKEAERAWERQLKKQDNFDGSGRLQIVGALSAMNVFANTALASFLPIFVINAAVTREVMSIPFDSKKMLIFIASALPILYLGKIVPKMVGLRYPYLYAYRLYRVAWLTNLFVGWIPRGLAYGLVKFRLMGRED